MGHFIKVLVGSAIMVWVFNLIHNLAEMVFGLAHLLQEILLLDIWIDFTQIHCAQYVSLKFHSSHNFKHLLKPFSLRMKCSPAMPELLVGFPSIRS